MNEKLIITFDDSIKKEVIEAVGYKEENTTLVSSSGKLATSQGYESISSNDFGGVLIGSKIPIKNEESELVRYFISDNC